jgi:3-hydroxybutyryl-CoA dehydrogenase
VEASEIGRAGVIGCGLMGSGIVEVFARAGIDVTVMELDEELLATGLGRLETSTAKAVDRGKLSDPEREALIARVTGTTHVSDLADVDVVVEAATENEAAKLAILRSVDEVVRPDVVLASNTSSIPIATLGMATKRPDKVVGLHFFNPPPVMELIEVTPSLMTSDETLAFARALAERLGRRSVVAKDTAGFIVNRLLNPYLCAAIRALDEGIASREDIDTAMTLGLNHPMGPLRLADLIGLDTVLQIAEVLREEFHEPAYAPPPLLKRMVVAGKLGRKSGSGFYDY